VSVLVSCGFFNNVYKLGGLKQQKFVLMRPEVQSQISPGQTQVIKQGYASLGGLRAESIP
jgi:hypothetical protein